MKRLFSVILLLCLLTSCSHENRDYFAQPRKLSVTFEDGTLTSTGVLTTDTDGIVFCPNSIEGLAVKISGETGEVTLDGITFGRDNATYTRFYPIYEALTSNNIELTFKKGCPHPVTAEGNGFKITIHKEIQIT